MNHALRSFRKEDAQGVKELILGVLAKEYPFDKSAYSDSDLDKIGEVYGGPRDAFFLIEESSDVVGTAAVKAESKDDALLRRFFVDLKHRRRGYGSELIKKVINFCKEKGYKKIYFRCTDRMIDAMSLCKKHGFKETDSLEVSGFKIHKLEMEL